MFRHSFRRQFSVHHSATDGVLGSVRRGNFVRHMDIRDSTQLGGVVLARGTIGVRGTVVDSVGSHRVHLGGNFSSTRVRDFLDVVGHFMGGLRRRGSWGFDGVGGEMWTTLGLGSTFRCKQNCG